MRALTLFLFLALATPGAAFAHGSGPEMHESWTLEPWVVVPLGLSGLVWSVGVIRRWRRSQGGRKLLRWESIWFAAGWLILGLALVSPLHIAGSHSFTLHMLEHEAIMMLAAPLLVLGKPVPTLLWAWPHPARVALGALGSRSQVVWRAMSSPLPATLAQAAALWLWHMPMLFNLALGSEVWHALQHLSFLLTALLFWSAMVDRRQPIALRALCLFATSIVSGALGALMAVSQSPWYGPYALLGMTPQGLTPAEDQQLAGVLMWVPGGLVHAVAALALLAPVLRSDARQERMP